MKMSVLKNVSFAAIGTFWSGVALISILACGGGGGSTPGGDTGASGDAAPQTDAGDVSPSGCTTNGDCASDEYCDVGSNASCGGSGTCKTRPTLCTQQYSPVCGCDGTTYPNECEAHAAGVNVEHQGTCTGDCSTNADCGSGEYCDFGGSSCGPTGSCQIQPQYCTQEYDPVCGCDGSTYSNGCMANAAGVSVQYEGRCSATN